MRDLVEHAPDIASLLAASWDDIPLTARLLEQLLVSEDVLSLPPNIAGKLLQLYEHFVRCGSADAPNTTWELPVSGFRDLQPMTVFCRGAL